jgi:hypothetical protein
MSSIHVINGMNYLKAEYVREICPAFFVGCMRSARKLIERKQINENEYLFATYVNSTNEWKPSSIKVNKAALLLTEDWVVKNVPKFGNKEEQELEVSTAPPILLLNDEEKFKDADGNSLEVEVRGERHPDKIFFYGKDIASILSVEKIKDILINHTSSYEEGIHYKKFIHSQAGSTRLGADKKISRTTIFLTYRGLIRMLMTRRDPISKLFEEWAINILFTHQLGTTEQKEELVSTLIGSSVESVRDFLSSSPSKYSELYLICIGKASYLKDSLQLKNTCLENDLVFKFGFTDDLSRRLNEHKNKFSKLNGTNISVVLHSPIDPKFLSKAEMELKKYFQDEDACIENQVYKELVVLPEKRLKGVRREFKDICYKYAGCMERIQDEMNKLKESFEVEKKTREKELEHAHMIKEKEVEQVHMIKEKEVEHAHMIKIIEMENLIKTREKEAEHLAKVKEIEMTCEIKTLEKQLENQEKMMEKNRIEFISILETTKREYKDNLEIMESKHRDMLDYLMSSLKEITK